MDISRRCIIGAFGGCLCGQLFPNSAFTKQPSSGTSKFEIVLHGCEVSEADLKNADGTIFESLVRTTGNTAIDIDLDRALKQLADCFDVHPGFGFYDDGNAPNAWASAKNVIPGTNGTVAFGQHYYKKWMDYDPTGISVLATCAHEFGHIMQYQSGHYDEIKGGLSTGKRIELHADYMSGFYIGLLKRQNPGASFWKAGDKFRQIGSFDDKDPMFHGTPTDRVAASQQGFVVGYYEGKDAKFAFASGMKYVADR